MKRWFRDGIALREALVRGRVCGDRTVPDLLIVICPYSGCGRAAFIDSRLSLAWQLPTSPSATDSGDCLELREDWVKEKRVRQVFEVAAPYLAPGEHVLIATIADVGTVSVARKAAVAVVVGIASLGTMIGTVKPRRLYIAVTERWLLFFEGNTASGRPGRELLMRLDKRQLTASEPKEGPMRLSTTLSIGDQPNALKVTFPRPCREEGRRLLADLGPAVHRYGSRPGPGYGDRQYGPGPDDRRYNPGPVPGDRRYGPGAGDHRHGPGPGTGLGDRRYGPGPGDGRYGPDSGDRRYGSVPGPGPADRPYRPGPGSGHGNPQYGAGAPDPRYGAGPRDPRYGSNPW